MELRSQALSHVDDETLRNLREQQFNSVVVPAAMARSVWPVADRVGMLVFADGAIESNGLLHPSAVPARIH